MMKSFRTQCHKSALFSLFWSTFYAGRVVLFAVTNYKFGNLRQTEQNIPWEVPQCVLASMGIVVSLSMFNAYKKNNGAFIVYSWMTWMFCNLLMAVVLLHKVIFAMIYDPSTSPVVMFNDAMDLAHIFNAPSTIFLILTFLAHYCGEHDLGTSRDILFGAIRTNNGYRQLDKFEVLHLHEDVAEEDIVYYV